MAKTPPDKRYKLQDATKPLDNFDRMARKRLGLPPREKLVNPSRRPWLPPLLLLLFAAACVIGFGFNVFRRRGAVLPYPKPLAVSFFNVGQGDSTLIQTPSGKNILIDTGPPAARGEIFAELRQRSVNRLDMLVTSHPDQDHYGNSLAVLLLLPTATVVDSGFVKGSLTQRDLLAEIKRQNIPFVNVTQKHLIGTSQDLGDGVTLSYLAPVAYSSNANDNSLVLKITLGRVGFLFMGDAEDGERASLLANGRDVQATILKVAHHGSRNGTDDAFLTRVHPEVAVISCGLGNRYGHPQAETLDALRWAGVNVWRTDLQGTINIQTDGKTYKVSPSAK